MCTKNVLNNFSNKILRIRMHYVDSFVWNLCLTLIFFQLWTVFWELTMLSPGSLWRMLFHHIPMLGPWRGLIQWHWSLPHPTWISNFPFAFVKSCNLLQLCYLFVYSINPFITDKKKVKSGSTLGDIAHQQAVKLGLSV